MPRTTKRTRHCIEAAHPAIAAARSALTVVNGGAGLTPPQQMLLRMFAGYLRTVPLCDWFDNTNNAPVVHLLRWNGVQRVPEWKPEADGQWYLNELPDADSDLFKYLKLNVSRHAANEDPEQLELRASIAFAKDNLKRAAQEYEDFLRENGLRVDRVLNLPLTPLEIAAQASYEENHQEQQ